MITLNGVTKTYHSKGIKKLILDDVSFHFPRDKNIAIVGNNGAGKSTLMRILAGIELPDSGRIHRRVNISWPLGFAGGFNGSMTGIENIRFIARIYGQDTESVLDYVSEFSELGDSLRLPIKTYSSGMKARLAFGLSMAVEFDCYLIDEITAVGDANFNRKCQQVFESKLADSKVIMISHSMQQIRKNCDSGVLLKQGKFHYFEQIDELIDAYQNQD